jgi:two-component system sensor histidine kinase SenX3
VDATIGAILGGAVGLVLGAVAVAATRFSERRMTEIPASEESHPALPPGTAAVLSVLRSIGIVLDSSDAVVNNSPSAVSYGLVRNGELVHPELRALARQVRRDGQIREVELELPKGGAGSAVTIMRVRVAPLGGQHILLLAEDHTKARRVEETRRDFVVNVSHELKTPVGGIALLAEAVLDAKDDPVAVERFAQRIQVESARLTQLVKEVVDLSRIQVADALHEPELVEIPEIIALAVDRARVSADAKDMVIDTQVSGRPEVFGDGELLTTAVSNLVTNAINYSDPSTRVAIAAREVGDLVEITVSDQGHGIPQAEQARIFERFYRIDAARSRANGGTGLGLAIVKHVCSTHGGEVTVWSEDGHGSTFTMRLPAAHPVEPSARPDGPTTPQPVSHAPVPMTTPATRGEQNA